MGDTAKKHDEKAAPTQDTAAAPKAKVKLAHPAPSEWDGLPEGVNGGPATADNPEASALLSTEKERKERANSK